VKCSRSRSFGPAIITANLRITPYDFKINPPNHQRAGIIAPMQVMVQPRMQQWQPRRPGAVVNRAPVIATGHQPWLWHPGIFAKYLAADRAAAQFGGQSGHIIVDTDLIDGLDLLLPVRHAQKLSTYRLELAPISRLQPVVLQKPVDAAAVVHALREVPHRVEGEVLADLSPLVQAWRDLPPARHLGEQIAHVLERLMQPYIQPMRRWYASELLHDEAGQAVVEAMLADAVTCAHQYNRAVAQYPEARIRPLHIGVERVQLPLWSLHGNVRQPVYAYRGGRGVAELDGPREALAPRALLLTALMRSRHCDLFIHGRGGGAYDRITEMWWRNWRGQQLSPMAVVSADVTMDLDVPLADDGQLSRAQWYAHHLPSNVDRVLKLDDARSRRKRELLRAMAEDHDKSHRAAAFAELHRINAAMTEEHAALIADARQQVAQQREAADNALIARKRDWCFALYPPATLRTLAAALQ